MTEHVTAAPTIRRTSTTSISRPDWAAKLLTVDRTTPIALSLMGSVLCIAIGLIHIQDQGGLPGNQSPSWLAIGYYAVEIAAGISTLLLARQHFIGWLFALGVSAGPATGYILSRTVGLPGDSGDIGNWGYTLGTVSLIVEGALLAMAALVLGRAVGQRGRAIGRRGLGGGSGGGLRAPGWSRGGGGHRGPGLVTRRAVPRRGSPPF